MCITPLCCRMCEITASSIEKIVDLGGGIQGILVK